MFNRGMQVTPTRLAKVKQSMKPKCWQNTNFLYMQGKVSHQYCSAEQFGNIKVGDRIRDSTLECTPSTDNSPQALLHLFREIKFYWNTAPPTFFHAGCLLSHYDDRVEYGQQWLSHKTKTYYSLIHIQEVCEPCSELTLLKL